MTNRGQTLAAAFHNDGFLLIEGALSVESCQRLRSEVERILELLTAGRELDRRVHCWTLPNGDPYVFKVKPIIDLSAPLAELQVNPTLIEILDAIDYRNSVLIENKIMLKQVVPSLAGRVPANMLGAEVHRHLDSSYFVRRGFTREIVSSGFLLDDCEMDSGPVRVWPGSHRMEVAVEDGGIHGPVVNEESAPDRDAVPLVGPAGSLLLWESRLIHDSRPNFCGRPRRLVVFGHEKA